MARLIQVYLYALPVLVIASWGLDKPLSLTGTTALLTALICCVALDYIKKDSARAIELASMDGLKSKDREDLEVMKAELTAIKNHLIKSNNASALRDILKNVKGASAKD